MRKLNFYNERHLGDCLYTIHYFNKLHKAHSKLDIHFYCNPNYHFELQLWIDGNITLHDIIQKPEDAINTWIGENDFYWKNLTPTFNNQFDHFYIAYFNMLSSKAGVDNPIEEIHDMLFDNKEITNGYGNEFDYLIINSQPLSGQVDENAVQNLNKFVVEQLWDFKIISTARIPNTNVACTLDYGYTLMDIAHLSCCCKNIIGIHTAPYLPCFNAFNIDTIKNWVIIQKQGLTYSFNNRIRNIKSSEEL